MASEFRVEVAGDPRGQGSMTLWRAPDGTERAKHPNATVLYRNRVIGLMAEQWGGRAPLVGPVCVSVEAVFPHLKGHYGAKGLKASAPKWKTTYPDLDKIVRLVNDALTIAGVVRDDSQVVALAAAKRFGSVGRATITVTSAEGGDLW